jgi:hypothetical protein
MVWSHLFTGTPFIHAYSRRFDQFCSFGVVNYSGIGSLCGGSLLNGASHRSSDGIHHRLTSPDVHHIHHHHHSHRHQSDHVFSAESVDRLLPMRDSSFGRHGVTPLVTYQTPEYGLPVDRRAYLSADHVLCPPESFNPAYYRGSANADRITVNCWTDAFG